jgi:hypothetical protein
MSGGVNLTPSQHDDDIPDIMRCYPANMHDRAQYRQTDLAVLASVPCLPSGSSEGTPIHDTMMG